MATKKSSKKTEEKVEEPVEEVLVEEPAPVEEPTPTPAPKAEKKAAKGKKELPEMVGYDKSAATFVEEAHQALLGRNATDREIEYYAGLVDVKGFMLPEIVRQMKMSAEYQATLPLIES
jgi:outer membrane biosynthesis protein TonB